MVYKNFYIGIISIAISIIGTAYLISLIGFNKEYLHTIIFLHILFVLEFIWLISFVNKTNRMLDRFFASIKEDGTSIKFEHAFEENTFKLLSKRLNNVVETISKARIEKENEHYYLQYMIEHINTGIISVLNNEKIDLLNKKGCEILNIKSLTRIAELKQFGNNFHKMCLNIRTGEHTLAKAIVNNEIIELSVRASEFKLFNNGYKLISFHDIHQEIEQKEIDAWQKIIKIMAHEILSSISPISSLSNHLSSLLKQDKNKYLIDVIDGVNIIHQRSDGLMNFVSKYRQISDIPKPILNRIKLNRIINDLALLCKSEFNLESILSISKTQDDIFLNIDKDLTIQAVLNIIRNAAQAVAKTKNPKISISGYTKNNYTFIEIHDNGDGIDTEDLENIFIPFFTTKNGGSGIGLTIAKQLIISQGGSIEVQSVKNIMTTVLIKFESQK